MKEFKILLNNTENFPQLFRYLLDAQIEISEEKGRATKATLTTICGEFFDNAFGLELTEDGRQRLGQFIREGKFKPLSMRGGFGNKLRDMEWHSGRIGMYWNNL